MSEENVRPADDFFNKRREASIAEDRVLAMILEAAGFDFMEPEEWPCEDFTYDDYDSSFEFKGTKESFVPTKDMLPKWWALGFHQCWICYTNKTQIYCCGDHIGEREYRPFL